MALSPIQRFADLSTTMKYDGFAKTPHVSSVVALYSAKFIKENLMKSNLRPLLVSPPNKSFSRLRMSSFRPILEVNLRLKR